MLQNVVLLGFKSFQFRRRSDQDAKRNSVHNLCHAHIKLSSKQAEKCQIIVVISAYDPEWVAFIPRPYLITSSNTTKETIISLGPSVSPTLARMCPLPVELAPFIMPGSFLGQAMDNLAANAADANVEL